MPELAPDSVLTGELAAAYEEWRDAAAQLEGLFAAYQNAKERHAVALARFTRLATGKPR